MKVSQKWCSALLLLGQHFDPHCKDNGLAIYCEEICMPHFAVPTLYSQ